MGPLGCHDMRNVLSNVSWADSDFLILVVDQSVMKKVQVGNDQEMAQSERNSHSTNRRVGKH